MIAKASQVPKEPSKEDAQLQRLRYRNTLAASGFIGTKAGQVRGLGVQKLPAPRGSGEAAERSKVQVQVHIWLLLTGLPSASSFEKH